METGFFRRGVFGDDVVYIHEKRFSRYPVQLKKGGTSSERKYEEEEDEEEGGKEEEARQQTTLLK